MSLPRSEFLSVMTSVLKDPQWAQISLDSFLEMEGIEYGDDSYEWEEWAAVELAEIELSYE